MSAKETKNEEIKNEETVVNEKKVKKNNKFYSQKLKLLSYMKEEVIREELYSKILKLKGGK